MSGLAERLDQQLRAAGIPIHGVSIGDENNRATWRIDFQDTATQAQRDQAGVLMAAYVTPTPQTLLDETATRDVDEKKLRAVAQALWECIPSPTMTKAQMRARAIAIYKTL